MFDISPLCVGITHYCLDYFVLPEIISSSKDKLSINLDDPKLLKNNHQIFIGGLTKRYARDMNIIGTAQYKKVLKESRKF